MLAPRARLAVVTAAADPTGDPTLLWRAIERLGMAGDAIAPAVDSGLLTIGPRVVFRHPAVRSVVYRSAPPRDRRAAHRALAQVTVKPVDRDRRAWHQGMRPRALTKPARPSSSGRLAERSIEVVWRHRPPSSSARRCHTICITTIVAGPGRGRHRATGRRAGGGDQGPGDGRSGSPRRRPGAGRRHSLAGAGPDSHRRRTQLLVDAARRLDGVNVAQARVATGTHSGRRSALLDWPPPAAERRTSCWPCGKLRTRNGPPRPLCCSMVLRPASAEVTKWAPRGCARR